MGMLWKIQKICSTMGTKIFEIDEEMSEIIDAKVGNPQNSTSKKWANFSQPWNLAFFRDYIFKKYDHFQSQRAPKWKIAHIWQSKGHKNNKKTPYNVSVRCCQSLPVVLQHPVYVKLIKYALSLYTLIWSDGLMVSLYTHMVWWISVEQFKQIKYHTIQLSIPQDDNDVSSGRFQSCFFNP